MQAPHLFVASAGVLTFDSTASGDRHFIAHDDFLPIAIYPLHLEPFNGRLCVKEDAPYIFTLPEAGVVRFPARASIELWVWNDYLKVKCKKQGLWYAQGLSELMTMKAKIMLEEDEAEKLLEGV